MESIGRWVRLRMRSPREFCLFGAALVGFFFTVVGALTVHSWFQMYRVSQGSGQWEAADLYNSVRNGSYSVVMLNFKRPLNIEYIVSSYVEDPLLHRILIFNNDASHDLSELVRRYGVAKVLVVSATDNVGIGFNRFFLGSIAGTHAVLTQDDDIFLPESTRHELLHRFEKEPQVLHGLFCRRPSSTESGSLRYRGVDAPPLVSGSNDCPILITRALVLSRDNCLDYFAHIAQFDDFLPASKPFGHGEDILISLFALLPPHTNRMNRAYPDLPSQNLPEGAVAVSKNTGHGNFRTSLLNAACERLHLPCTDWIWRSDSQ